MNLKLRRLVRTPYSEQYALFDLDGDTAGDKPTSIGKLDLHFSQGGVYGTVLIWQKAIMDWSQEQRRAFVEALLSDISQPAGLPNQFAVEFFSPDLSSYEFFHNLNADTTDGGK